jgi:hypothetical protein
MHLTCTCTTRVLMRELMVVSRIMCHWSVTRVCPIIPCSIGFRAHSNRKMFTVQAPRKKSKGLRRRKITKKTRLFNRSLKKIGLFVINFTLKTKSACSKTRISARVRLEKVNEKRIRRFKTRGNKSNCIKSQKL